MSFMFNPYPYDDPNAFNVLDPSGLPLSELVERRRKRQKPPGP